MRAFQAVFSNGHSRGQVIGCRFRPAESRTGGTGVTVAKDVTGGEVVTISGLLRGATGI